MQVTPFSRTKRDLAIKIWPYIYGRWWLRSKARSWTTVHNQVRSTQDRHDQCVPPTPFSHTRDTWTCTPRRCTKTERPMQQPKTHENHCRRLQRSVLNSTGVSLSAHGLCFVSHKKTVSHSVFLDRCMCRSLIVFATDTMNKHLKLWMESCSRKKQEGCAFVSRIRFFTHGNLFTWLVQLGMVVRRTRLSSSRFLQHVGRTP